VARRPVARRPVARRPIALLTCALLATALLVGGCPTGPKRNPKVSKTRYKLGHDYFVRATKARNDAVRTRFINIALLELKKSLKADDTNHHAHFLIALLYIHKAQRALDDAHVHQCAAGEEAREYEKDADELMAKARKHLEKAFALRNRKDSRVALNLSTVALHFKKYARAEKYARLALTNIAYSTPHLARANIGRAQFERGQLKRASKNLKQAIFAEARFCAGHYWLGRVDFALKNYKQAATRFESALACCRKEKIAPIQEALLYRGLALMRLGNSAEALAVLTRCVKQAPTGCVAQRCRRSLKAVKGSSP
jgi:tetratricopeptide (TPR) repeat protein